MANCIWRGNAAYATEVHTITPGGTWESTDVINITINGKTLSLAAGSTTISTICDNIVAAWAALTAAGGYPEFAEITATRSGSTVLLTHNTVGVPFTCAVETTETGGGAADGQTLGISVTTAATGPNHWDDADNWSNGAVPVSSDDVYIDNSNVDILYGLDNNSVTLTSLTITRRFTGTIGLPTRNASDYDEYRDQYLKISATTLTIGSGDGSGSGRIKINVGSVQCALIVKGSGNPSESSIPAILWIGTHASNTVDIAGGSVGIAALPFEAATVLTLRQTGGTLLCGTGVTMTTFNKSDGTATQQSNLTTLTNEGGTVNKLAGTVTTLNVNGGTCNYDSTGTITTANVYGALNFNGNNAAKTVTNCNVYPGGSISDKFDVVTFTNPIAWKGKLAITAG